MSRTASIFTFQRDGTRSSASKTEDSDRMYAALKAAVIALRGNARDLHRMGATRDSYLELEYARLIDEALQ